MLQYLATYFQLEITLYYENYLDYSVQLIYRENKCYFFKENQLLSYHMTDYVIHNLRFV